jgi:hypothetical protein
VWSVEDKLAKLESKPEEELEEELAEEATFSLV